MKITRFKRGEFHGEYAGNEPKWHIALKRYQKGEWYGDLKAQCGYVYEGGTLDGNTKISIAVKEPKGEQCKRCIKVFNEKLKAMREGANNESQEQEQ